MRILQRTVSGLTGVLGVVANLLLVMMLLVIGSQVVARFVLGAPTMWAEELGRYLLVAITMIGSAVLIEKNDHIAIDTFVEILPKRLRVVIAWMRDAISLTVCGLIAWYGWTLVGIGARQTSTGLPIKMSLPYLAIPIGAALMAAVLVLSRLNRQEG
ncbi:MAG: TRAP transporter small permease [Paracoccus sp. (in: a-proteobacteria)]|uniref:TRAP transporter small permease n=1 Tax=Paracoccus sp. TaxID=267 RepID=UPI0026DFDB3F|nr:TRAP transporter small permease [Paracoccus sp. (in: a-proteobacteria)]MDO5631604.1 TRAP transporter small permease [Paracoccus sp. (in: a-proteobacteria)]